MTDEPAESAEVTDGDEEIAANSPAQPTPAAAGPSVTAAASTDEVDPFDEIREALLAELPSHAWVLLQGKEGAEASYLLGEAALALGRYAEAQDAFTNATLESAPGDMAPWGGLAQALLMQGHQDAAQGAIRDWLKGRDANTREFLLMRERARRTRIRMGPPAAAPSDDG